MLALWLVFYASFTLLRPALLDDADSVHAEVAREMLLRHDFVTLYANGIRYLEKAPLLYWAMAACMRVAQLLGHSGPNALAAAARIPLALTVLALALAVESLARRIFRSARAGLYAALILLSSFGIFLFTRITIPDAAVCLWITLALAAFWRTEQYEATPIRVSHVPRTWGHGFLSSLRAQCWLFAAACALNVLTKGLIGIVFPIAIVALYLLLTRGLRNALHRLTQLHPLSSLAIFLAIAAPWHILAALHNPTQGHPLPILFLHGHWQVPLPTDGNVHGWLWFYFVNEQLLRYLNLRVPRDYDTVPLYLFWGLCLIWLMPWSAFLLGAITKPLRTAWADYRSGHIFPRRAAFATPEIFLLLWAAFPLLFFSLSTRQEYYVLPSLPALILLIAGRLAPTPGSSAPIHQTASFNIRRKDLDRIAIVLLAIGSLAAAICLYFALHSGPPPAHTPLADILSQNPSDYALSMGHLLDLTGHAMSFFRLPLTLAAIALLGGPLANYLLRRRSQPHAANLSLAAGAFLFLLAAHLGLQIFAPVLTSAQLARTIAPQVRPGDLIVLHGEYEAGSTLGFYLQRPGALAAPSSDSQYLHILEGRSSNLWYGSFFPDAPPIFETPATLAAKWPGPQRIFLWQSLTDPPSQLPQLPGPVYILVKSGGKEIVSNQPAR